LAGTALGLVWTVVAGLLLNPWFGTFSFSAYSCWIPAGAVGIVTFISRNAETKRGLSEVNTLIVCTFIAIILGIAPFSKWFNRPESVTVVTIKWERGSRTRETTGSSLDHKDLEFLKSAGVTGHVQRITSGKYGNGLPNGRVVLVAYKQIERPIQLALPDAMEIYYIQSEDGWLRYPSDARVLERRIRLVQDESQPARATLFQIENADGSHQGGTAFIW
jgi:hypothetical protein